MENRNRNRDTDELNFEKCIKHQLVRIRRKENLRKGVFAEMKKSVTTHLLEMFV